MTKNLPAPVERYFAGKNARDFDTAVSGFSGSSIVRDEGRDHHGPAAIRAWMEETAGKYDDKAQVRSVSTDRETVRVAALVSGTFPGSPVTLRFTFTLDGDRIGLLEIAP